MKINSKNVLCSLLTVFMLLSTLLVPCKAFAQDNEVSISMTDMNTPSLMGSSPMINYPSTKSITITGNVTRVDFTGTYNTWLGLGSPGIIVLRFTNRATGDYRSHSFVCDNGYYSDSLGYTLPAGTYDITQTVNTVKQFVNLQLQFR